MRSIVDDALGEYPSFEDISKRVKIENDAHIIRVKWVAEEIFADGMVNSGRIITLLVFGGLVARYCKERKILDSTEKIINMISTVLIEKLGLWIVQQGGWVCRK